jgi:hypothetical protein
MQGVHLLGIVLMVFILLWIVSIYRRKKEGFEESEDSAHDTFNLKGKEKYNNVGTALHASKNIGILGTDSQYLLGSVIDVMGLDNRIEQEIDDRFPLEEGKAGMLANIDMCQKVKVTDCSVFDDPEFSSTCGLCLTVGTDSENKPVTGGLVLTKPDRDFARSTRKGNFLPSYEPTVGTCPAGMFVSNKQECLRVQNQQSCAQGSTFDTPTGCAQCYIDATYSIVNPDSDPDNPNPDLIVGYGTLTLYGEGTLKYKQASNESFITKKLKPDKAIKITLAGEEYDNILTLNVIADTPSNPDDESIIPPPAYIMGYLQGPTTSGVFNSDLYRLVSSDSLTGRRPRVAGPTKKDGVDITKLTPGFGQKDMSLTMKPVFTFVDPFSQEATLCPNSPFITKAASATFLGSDPCYSKGSKPGNYSLECLQNLFITNGCLNAGKGYPETSENATGLLYDETNNPRGLNDITTNIYNMAILSSTGNNENGAKATIEEWSAASEFCTGKKITSPCDTDAKDTGPLTVECLTYLWDNRGENNPEGPTYTTPPNAHSLFSKGRSNRFCTHMGKQSPVDEKGNPNTAALAFWKKQGGTQAVKAIMNNIHKTANNTALSDSAKKVYLLQCYGLIPNDATTNFASKWLSASGTTDDSKPSPIYDPETKECINAVEKTGFIPRVTWGTTPAPTNQKSICDDLLCQYFVDKYSGYDNVPSLYSAETAYCRSKYPDLVEVGSPQPKPATDYSNSVRYYVGDRVKFKGDIYLMVEAAGFPGYAPDRVGDRLWKLGGPIPGGNVWDISTPRMVGVVDIPVGDYILSFDITAKAKSPGDWGNIIHVSRTGTNCCDVGSRSPAIWFFPNSTSLHVRIGDTSNGNWGLDTDALPIGQKVRFTLTAKGSAVTVKLEGGSMNKVYNATQPTSRPTGSGFKIYMNDTQFAGGFVAAPARIEGLNYMVDGKQIQVLQTGNWPVLPQPAPPPLKVPGRTGPGWNF